MHIDSIAAGRLLGQPISRARRRTRMRREREKCSYLITQASQADSKQIETRSGERELTCLFAIAKYWPRPPRPTDPSAPVEYDLASSTWTHAHKQLANACARTKHQRGQLSKTKDSLERSAEVNGAEKDGARNHLYCNCLRPSRVRSDTFVACW